MAKKGYPTGMYGTNNSGNKKENKSSLGTGYENKPMEKSAPAGKKRKVKLRRY